MSFVTTGRSFARIAGFLSWKSATKRCVPGFGSSQYGPGLGVLMMLSACAEPKAEPEAPQPPAAYPAPEQKPPVTEVGLSTPASSADPCSSLLPDFQSSTPPHDITQPITPESLAVFAWQHFVALNWQASYEQSSQRGTPDTSQSFFLSQGQTQPTLTVWETYRHRNELYPQGAATNPPNSNFDASPQYRYQGTIAACDASTDTDPNALNNLDEASQLGLDYVFAHVAATELGDLQKFVVNGQSTAGFSPAQVLFQAKVNRANYEYIVTNRLYYDGTGSPRATLTARNTKALATYGGICPSTQPTYCNQGPVDPSKDTQAGFCLPCGGSQSEGSIHVKSAWRLLSQQEIESKRYLTTQNFVYYKQSGGKTCYTNGVGQTFGLVGLHIIHKTESIPEFLFASWEHVDNPASQLAYVNTSTGGPTPGETKAWQRVAHDGSSLPSQAVQAVNQCVQKQIRMQNDSLVFQNYQLVGVQGKVVDYANRSTDLPDYFLANNVIESNDFFQSFVGNKGQYSATGTGPAGTTLGTNVTVGGQNFDMGGCQGCHGNAQQGGTDFSFLAPGFSDQADAMGEFSGVSSAQPTKLLQRYQKLFKKK